MHAVLAVVVPHHAGEVTDLIVACHETQDLCETMSDLSINSTVDDNENEERNDTMDHTVEIDTVELDIEMVGPQAGRFNSLIETSRIGIFYGDIHG